MKKDNEVPIIHIGYAKSASTTLQKQLFNRHPEINNLGLFPTKNVGRDSDYIDENCPYLKDEKIKEFYDNLVMLSSLEYEYSNNIDIFKNHVEKYINNKQVTVFSNERFTSVFFSHDDVVVKANRLKEIFSEAKIFVIIRNQLDLIKSQYRDHPFDPRSLTIGKPVSLEEWIKIAYEAEEVNFLSSLKYYEIIDYYAKLFGKENIEVFLLENLANNIQQFADEISDFMDIDFSLTLDCLKNKQENKSVSHRYNKYRGLRRKIPFNIEIRKLMPDWFCDLILNYLKRGKKEKCFINSYWIKKLNKYYAKSNKKLQEKYNIKLHKYDYPL